MAHIFKSFRILINFDDIFKRVQAHIALINMNLNPEGAATDNSVSWDDRRDSAMLKFKFMESGNEIARRLKGWNACVGWRDEDSCMIFEFTERISQYSDLIYSSIQDILVLHYVAEKLAAGKAGTGYRTDELGERAKNEAYMLLENLVSALCIFDN